MAKLVREGFMNEMKFECFFLKDEKDISYEILNIVSF